MKDEIVQREGKKDTDHDKGKKSCEISVLVFYSRNGGDQGGLGHSVWGWAVQECEMQLGTAGSCERVRTNSQAERQLVFLRTAIKNQQRCYPVLNH